MRLLQQLVAIAAVGGTGVSAAQGNALRTLILGGHRVHTTATLSQ
jgi:hypothetical protein